MSDTLREIVTAKQVADEWQVPLKTVYKLTAEKRLPVMRFGRHYRYRRTDVVAALSQDPDEQPAVGA